MAKEASIESELIRGARKRRFLVRKAQWVAREGCPDRVLMGYGLTLWVELKNPDGSGELREGQIREHRLLREAGALLFVVVTFRQLEEFWDWVDRRVDYLT